MQYPIIIAHRGESFDAPENSLAAINLAWKRGASAVELDVQLTKDNQIVVFHDLNTKRITGANKQIKDSTLKELKKLDAGSFKDNQWKHEQIPTLSEVLKTVPSHGKLIIEIKSDSSILEKLKEELSQSGLLNAQIEIIAFNLNTLATAKQLMPQYNMLWLLDLDYSIPWWLCFVNKKRISRKVKNYGLDGVDVFSGILLNKTFISYFKTEGLLVYTWTINNPKKAEELIHLGIDGITTDRANWMTLQLKHIIST